DITAGSVLLTITTNDPDGAGPCLAATDDMTLTINPIATSNANIDDTVCAGSSYTLNGIIGGSATTSLWSSSGTGFFDDASQLAATYTPSPVDSSAGSVVLTLTSDDPDGAGPCGQAVDAMLLTLNTVAIVSAGNDTVICEGFSYTLDGTVGGSAATVTWMTTGSGTFDNVALLSATYSPSAADISAGIVTLGITTDDPTGPCLSVSDSMVIIIDPAVIVNANVNDTLCQGSSYTLSGVIGGSALSAYWVTSGTGTFDDTTLLAAIYTPSQADDTSGAVTLTLTTNNPAGPCNAISDPMVLTINPIPTVDAGPVDTLCEGNSYVLSGVMGGSTSGITWTTTTGGVFDNATLLNASYTPSVLDITAGTVILFIASNDPDGSGPCIIVTDSVQLGINPTAIVNAGPDDTICATSSYLIPATIGGATSTIVWTSSGTGSFDDAALVTATYTPSAADTVFGSVVLTITSDDPDAAGPCTAVIDVMVLNITKEIKVVAGADLTICANNPSISLGGSVSNGSTTGVWSTSGSGAFAPSNNDLNAVYTASDADTAASGVTLYLTSSNNGPCIPVVDSLTITIDPGIYVNAGPDDTVCVNNATVSLSGSVWGGTTTTGVWTTSGTGSFDDSSLFNAIYSPSVADTLAGSVVLTLTSTNNVLCIAVADSMIATFSPGIFVDAGTAQTVCANNSSVNLAGLVNGATTLTGVWTTAGTGTFSDSSLLNGVYFPSPADTVATSVVLTLTSTNNLNCNPVADTMVISIGPGVYVTAGADTTVCANNDSVFLNGNVWGGTTTTGIWTSSGTGAFLPDSLELNATYIPSDSDTTVGVITLTLTSTNNLLCNPVSDDMVLTITPAPFVDAGADRFACTSSPTVTLAGIITGATSTGFWITLGTGAFNDSSLLGADYTPSAADIVAGQVTLVLEPTSIGLCLMVRDSMQIVITSTPVVVAGNDTTICDGDPVFLQGSVMGGAGTGLWTTSGNGTFSPDSVTLVGTYFSGPADAAAGFAYLKLESTNAPGCPIIEDSILVTITPAIVVNAGPDDSVCANNDTVILAASITGSTTTGIWSTSGTGVFFPDSSESSIYYLPSDSDTVLINIIITLTSTNNGNCQASSDSARITITTPPGVDAGPDLLVCKGDNVFLSSTIQGSAGSVLWSTNGSGSFDDSTLANPIYFPSTPDTTGGIIEMYLASTNNGDCSPAFDTVLVTFGSPTLVTVTADTTVCANNDTVFLFGTVIGASSTGQWSTSGSGTFLPTDSDLTGIYIPSAADDTTGSVILTLNATNSCLAFGTRTVTITPAPLANAGNDTIVCASDTSEAISGSVTAGSSTGIWSTLGSGSFFPNNSLSASYYRFSIADSTAGSVTLVLTSTANGNCVAETDTAIISMTTIPVVDAGNDLTFCANNAFAPLFGVVTGGSATGIWSTLGSGTFSPDNVTLNGFYTPSSADTSAGFAELILTSTNSCVNNQDTVVYFYTAAPQDSAGPDATVCANNPNIVLDGMVWASSSTGEWFTSGSGIFTPNNTTLNATYNPDSNDINAGGVILNLASTNNGTCFPANDSMNLTITAAPVVDAGLDEFVCNGDDIFLNGIITGPTSTGIWSATGSGTFDDPTLLNATYTPSGTDTMAGSVTFILSSTNNGNCISETDLVTFTLTTRPAVFAGADDSVCANSPIYALSGSVVNGPGTGIWSTSGTGSFGDDSNLVTTYTPSQADIDSGGVFIMLSSTNTCLVTDSMTLSIGPAPLVDAGVDQVYCINSPLVVLNGSISGG
ncbi:MAG: hypothetical protein COB85_09315, partial [Bacteroidetes bacterium]